MSCTIPDALLQRAAISDKVILLVSYGDDLLCSLDDLRNFDGLKIVLINRNTDFPLLSLKKDVFDFYLEFDGPAVGEFVDGSLPWLQKGGKTEILLEDVYYPVVQIVEALLGRMPNKEGLFLVTLHEETLMQIALIREKFSLKHGMSVKMTERFIDKTLMKRCFEEHGVTIAKYARMDASYLRSLSEAELSDFATEHLPEFPIFVKPTAASGSLEAGKLKNFDEFREWVARSDKLVFNEFLAEEVLLEPQYLTLLVFTPKGLEAVAVDDVLKSHGWQQMRDTGESTVDRFVRPSEMEELTSYSLKALGALGLTNEYGTYFVEVMRKSNGDFAALEVGARPPANLCGTRAAELVTGIDVESFAIAGPFLREPVHHSPQFPFTYILWSNPKESGRIVKHNEIQKEWLEDGVEVPMVLTFFKVGDVAKRTPHTMDDVVKTIIVAGADEAAVWKTVLTLKRNYEPVVVEPCSDT